MTGRHSALDFDTIAYVARRQPTTPAFTGSPVLTLRHVPFDQWQRYGSVYVPTWSSHNNSQVTSPGGVPSPENAAKRFCRAAMRLLSSLGAIAYFFSPEPQRT